MNLKKADQTLAEEIAKIKNIYLILDYDGTLTPIASRPSRAKLAPKMKALIRCLSVMPGIRIAVVSGRALSDLEKLVGLKSLDYVGNHGLERKIRGVAEIDPHAIRLRGFVAQLVKEMRRALKGIPGSIVEDKIYGLSVHYRNVRLHNIAKARRIFRHVWNDFSARIFFKVRPGKKVWEVRPTDGCSDKGKVIKLLRQSLPGRWRRGTAMVYAGDDRTDEDAFKVLNRPDFGIHVGHSARTSARYWLRSPGEVAIFLKRLMEARKRICSENVQR